VKIENVPHAHHGSHRRRHVQHRNARALHPDLVVAPMHGTIVSLSVVEGQDVQEGRLIVIMEAMKMEQPLRANRAGVVRDISVAVGDHVAPGAVICRIEEIAAS